MQATNINHNELFHRFHGWKEKAAQVLMAVTLLGLINCQKGKDDHSLLMTAGLLGLQPKLAAHLEDTALSAGPHALLAATSAGLQGLYFGELEMVAYDYRPGETNQEHNVSSGFTGSDWSYWVVAPSGYDTSRDNVLKKGAMLDPNWYPYSQALSGTRDFQIDAFEVAMLRTGIVYENQYYGYDNPQPGNRHILYKYPEWNGVPVHYTTPVFPGFEAAGQIQDVNVIFVRDDIVASPVDVQFSIIPGQSAYGDVESSSRPLTNAEHDFIVSLVHQGTKRRFYGHLVLVPFAGPVTISVNGETDDASRKYSWQNAQVKVEFDLSSAVNTDIAKTDLSIPTLTYAADATGVPLGLKVQIGSRLQ